MAMGHRKLTPLLDAISRHLSGWPRYRLNDPALGHRSGAAPARAHGAQLVAQGRKLAKPILHTDQVPRCDFRCFRTVALRLIGKREERTNFLDRETEPSPVPHEVQAIHVAVTIGASARGCALRCFEHTNLLVKADRRHLGRSRARQLTNLHLAFAPNHLLPSNFALAPTAARDCKEAR